MLTARVSTDPVALDKTSRPADANSSGSDLKVEIRTSSSGSGQVITDRWDTAHYPSHRALYDQHSDERAFPPFEKVSEGGWMSAGQDCDALELEAYAEVLD